jgi:hypothetical protein
MDDDVGTRRSDRRVKRDSIEDVKYDRGDSGGA